MVRRTSFVEVTDQQDKDGEWFERIQAGEISPAGINDFCDRKNYTFWAVNVFQFGQGRKVETHGDCRFPESRGFIYEGSKSNFLKKLKLHPNARGIEGLYWMAS